jgi:hypothetical protein
MKHFLSYVLTALVTLTIGYSAADARNCKKGKPCGNSCIAQNDVCHKEQTTSTMAAPEAKQTQAPAAAPAAPAPAAAAAPATAPAAKAKNCAKGKPCGNSCIPKDAVCHS